jgi:hypothetical protein
MTMHPGNGPRRVAAICEQRLESSLPALKNLDVAYQDAETRA